VRERLLRWTGVHILRRTQSRISRRYLDWLQDAAGDELLEQQLHHRLPRERERATRALDG